MREHYLFISIISFFALLTIGLTMTGLNNISGYHVAKGVCEPMSCQERGLEPTGIIECKGDICYRNCYQNKVLIEMATFCERI